MNNKHLQIIFLLAILLLSYLPSLTSARPEYAVKESRNCPYCHSRGGPPQLNQAGVYYGTHNHSFEGYVPSPEATPTPEPTKEMEIGIHMNTWDVGMRAIAAILLILIVVYIIRL